MVNRICSWDIIKWLIGMYIWLVVYQPLWKIWIRQLGWWHCQLNEQNNNMFQSTRQKSRILYRSSGQTTSSTIEWYQCCTMLSTHLGKLCRFTWSSAISHHIPIAAIHKHAGFGQVKIREDLPTPRFQYGVHSSDSFNHNFWWLNLKYPLKPYVSIASITTSGGENSGQSISCSSWASGWA